jgi:iron complex transport system ATP-binding protein
MADTTSFACNNLTVRVPGRTLVEKLGCELNGGQFLAVLGKNGAGKSLTLHTLAGLRPAAEGSVTVLGHDLTNISRRYLSQHLALLPQNIEDVFPSTVLDTVLIGRHPHIGRLQWESSRDRELALETLHKMDLGDLPDREIDSLSGGERQRTAVAQILVQSPDIYLLDEPTNHLDPQHQLDVLATFAAKAREGGIVIASLHDVNLAVRYADRCLVLFGDGRWELGETERILTRERMTELYATRMESVRWRDKELFVAAG